MQVSEIFYSIQGEGVNIGQPAIFLRLAGCHLRCSWCDSKFTWERTSGKKMSTAAIVKEIRQYPSKNLIITGGEPLLQQNALKELLGKLPKSYFVEMETSGSLKSYLHDYIDQYNCSPKLSNSFNREIRLEQLPPEKTFYKFVVDKPEDLEEIKSFISKYRLPEKHVLLMPQGTKKRELQERSQWLIELCKQENLRFCPRLHINIWGNKRKV